MIKYHLLNIYYVAGTVNIVSINPYIILQGKYYCNTHFVENKIEA